MQIFISHCVNYTEISPNFLVWKLCENCAFPQNFYPMKLGEIWHYNTFQSWIRRIFPKKVVIKNNLEIAHATSAQKVNLTCIRNLIYIFCKFNIHPVPKVTFSQENNLCQYIQYINMYNEILNTANTAVRFLKNVKACNKSPPGRNNRHF